MRFCSDTMLAMLTGILILACWVFLGVYWNISARSIKPTAEGQDWSGRLARMPIWLGYMLLSVIWAYPFGLVAIRRTAVSGSLAVAICALGLLVASAGLALFFVGFWIKLRQEERLLVRSFPEAYPAYRARVRALVPYVL